MVCYLKNEISVRMVVGGKRNEGYDGWEMLECGLEVRVENRTWRVWDVDRFKDKARSRLR